MWKEALKWFKLIILLVLVLLIAFKQIININSYSGLGKNKEALERLLSQFIYLCF